MNNMLKTSLVFCLCAVMIGNADARKLSTNFTSSTKLAAGDAASNSDMLNVNLIPEFRYKFNHRWQANISMRFEYFTGDIKGGTQDTFDDHSKRWELGEHFFSEFEDATIQYRNRSTRVTFGKQTFAWGVLDGLQVTDRLDASRKRESVFTTNRPDRISRWSVRTEFRSGKLRWDLALITDNTADQLALTKSTYEVKARRFRAGFTEAVSIDNLAVELSNKPTFGVKVSKRTRLGDLSFLSIHGPDTEPVFSLGESAISLNYKPRTLIGTTWQTSENARVWRIEVAHILDQPINVENLTPKVDKRGRWLAGVGMDWDLPKSTFLNAQIGIDHVQGDNLIRPNTDVIYTLKIQRRFMNDRLKLASELLGSLEGDGTLRPSIEWQVTDALFMLGGLDLVWGTNNELFGQFSDRDRMWLELKWFL